ncbi:MAG: hypothetical protein KGJ31_03365 [Patescibacteria group bacterium]|nr:hypothetical protein [Patescibacteria group bacterium]
MAYRWPTSFWLLLFFGLIALNVSVYREIFAPTVVKVWVFEVGKNSRAVLVRAPHGRALLIDTGPDASILRALGETLPVWQKMIDAVILTGTKASFVGGLPDVASRYIVSARIHFGDRDAPYGAPLIFDSVGIEIIAPGTEIISYGATSLNLSSSTPSGVYVSDGNVLQKEDASVS